MVEALCGLGIPADNFAPSDYRLDQPFLRYQLGRVAHGDLRGRLACPGDGVLGQRLGTNHVRRHLRWQTERLRICALRSGAETVMTWNLALQPAGGPHHGECADCCNGVMEITDGTYRRNAEYFVLGHLSRFAAAGARRISSESAECGPIQHVALLDADGARTLIALNTSDPGARFAVAEGDRVFNAELPAGAVGTFRWSADD